MNTAPQDKTPVILLMGPTASGKTDLAMQLFDELDCRLISVDSALVYRQLNIGTAKPTADEQQRYPHALIDIRDPDEPYSASNFRVDALREIDKAIAEKKQPVLVGGTMLYFKTLLQGIADLPSADEELRRTIVLQAEKQGWSALHQELAEFDPDSAARIKPGDSQRIQRAIEVYRLTGKTLTEFFAEQRDTAFPYPVISCAVAPPDRAVLRERIRSRFEHMLDNGLVAEVRHLLYSKGYDPDLPAMRSVGYRQVVEYINGDYDDEMLLEKAVTATARLAKRQMTWLRSWPKVVWLNTGEKDNVRKIKQQLATYN